MLVLVLASIVVLIWMVTDRGRLIRLDLTLGRVAFPVARLLLRVTRDPVRTGWVLFTAGAATQLRHVAAEAVAVASVAGGLLAAMNATAMVVVAGFGVLVLLDATRYLRDHDPSEARVLPRLWVLGMTMRCWWLLSGTAGTLDAALFRGSWSTQQFGLVLYGLALYVIFTPRPPRRRVIARALERARHVVDRLRPAPAPHPGWSGT